MKIGFISDVHGHIEALRKCLSLLSRQHVSHVCFLGDAVGYVPGIETVSEIASACSIRLKGNHEAMLLAADAIDDTRDKVYRLRETYESAWQSGTLAQIEAWPLKVEIEWDTCSLLLVHGSPTRPLDGYIYPDKDLPLLEGKWTHIICAHTHHPFVRRELELTWVNCGSVGLPRDDGRYGSMAVLDTKTGDVEVQRFDITRETQQAMMRAGQFGPEVEAGFSRRCKTKLQGTLIG